MIIIINNQKCIIQYYKLKSFKTKYLKTKIKKKKKLCHYDMKSF